MDLRIFTEPQQGASFATLLAAAQATREAGFSAFFRSDHILKMGSVDGLPGPSDSFVTLAAIAAAVPDIRLGTLVTSATFRHPSMLAIAAANIDDISGGRLELGLGSGWYEQEHTAYGIEFGESFGERFDRLTEQLEIITGLWDTPVGGSFEHRGKHFRLAGAPGLPKPRQIGRTGTPRVPIIIGGNGPKRTPALAARFADEFNIGFAALEAVRTQVQRVRAACERDGRDPETLIYSGAQVLCLGRDDAEVGRRAQAIGLPAERPDSDLAGTPQQVIDALGRWGEAGVQRMYLQVLDPDDLDHIALAGQTLISAVA